jgi:hypothetical protein
MSIWNEAPSSAVMPLMTLACLRRSILLESVYISESLSCSEEALEELSLELRREFLERRSVISVLAHCW